MLRFEHKGWRDVTEHYRRTSYYWALYLILFKIKNYFENGIIENIRR